MPKLTALTPIDHDGKPYAEGDTLDVSNDRQAQALIDLGAAELATATRKPRAKAGDKTLDPAAEAEALAEAEEAAAKAAAEANAPQ